MHPIHIGACGWSYADWKGVFYPAKLKPADYLAHYADHYPVVEVDSTYYRTPSKSMVLGWAAKTPESFRFSLKVPQVITHEKVLTDCESETALYQQAVRLLGDKLLCCVLQFGYFNKDAFPHLDAFLERLEPFLEAWPKDLALAVEVRNKTWMTEKLASVLRRHNAVWVLPDQAWMPTPLSLVEKLDPVTGPFAYVRLLGDRKAVDDATETLNRIVVDRTEELRADATAIRRLADRVPVLAFVNNHFAGFAVETMRQLREALENME